MHTDHIDRLARRRANAKLGWFGHAAIYLLVNTLLISIATFHGQSWAVFPLLGWGFGLLMHGLSVWASGLLLPLRERLVARERNKLMAQRDAW
jgi:hypothetical protein